MTIAARWSAWRARGPAQLAVTLGAFLCGFFLLPSSKAVNDIYYALVLAPALFLLRGSHWRWLATSHLWQVAMTLLAWLTLSGLWSVGFQWADWLAQAKALPYLGVYLTVLACVDADRPERFERLLRAVVLAGALGTALSAGVFYAHTPWPTRLEYAGAVYNANAASTIVGSALLLVMFHILPASRGRWPQAGWWACALILLCGIGLTGSRTSLGAVLLCGVLGLVLRRRWRVLASFGAVALVIGTLLASSDATRQALARGDSYRPAIWHQFAARVAQRPWFGEGVLTDDSTEVATPGDDTATLRFLHPHSVYLATALYGGLPALLLLLVLIAAALRQSWALVGAGQPVWLLAVLFAALCMLTDGDRLLHSPREIWLYFWLPIGVLAGRQAAAAARPIAPAVREPAPADRSK